jgi:hypothetical protein
MHSFQPGGLVGRLCAPRELVMLRSWRQDADGTYIVLYQSTQHRKARPAKPGLLRWGEGALGWGLAAAEGGVSGKSGWARFWGGLWGMVALRLTVGGSLRSG